jgi:hypothetical protein
MRPIRFSVISVLTEPLVATARNPQQLADLRAKYGKPVSTIALDGKNQRKHVKYLTLQSIHTDV